MNWQHFVRKSAVGRLLHLLMIAVVLTGSTGFGLVEHTCHFKKKTTFSIGVAAENPTCCPEACTAHHKHFKKAPCCTETTHYENVEVRSSLTEAVAKVGTLAVETLSQAFIYTASVVVEALLAFITTPHEQAAVPLSGRSLLVFVQSFLL